MTTYEIQQTVTVTIPKMLTYEKLYRFVLHSVIYAGILVRF